MALRIQHIPYFPDSSRYFRAIRHLPRPVWLDSGRPQGHFGRYDILAAGPRVQMTTRGDETLIARGSRVTRSSANPFDIVDEVLAEFRCDEAAGLPFCGGALGYFGYNLRQHVEPSHLDTGRDVGLPDMAVGCYDWALLQDHLRRESFMVALPGHRSADFDDLVRRFRAAAVPTEDSPNHDLRGQFRVGKLTSNFDLRSYRERLARILAYIRAGDCYQVNLAQRFSGAFEGDPLAAYCHLRSLLPAPYGAFLELDEGAVLSHSPETFLAVREGHVETRPIKGTAPRSTDSHTDRQNAQQLLDSIKDRAENLMIVDLLRNDLGKTCEIGSVRVPELFALESYANVHHLVSTVTGRLEPDCSPVQLLKGCFPGGSITGAPKIRAMEIIAELEQCDRSVYCGSIGYLSANGNMDTNIAIRSLACSGGKIHCWGGGGIVADSQADAEYAESLAKVRVLLEGLTGRTFP
ncbi:aminodeoxychorismate synthase component I [Gilvimarinus sp. F26214L]|uniref:aminodeoxychorismate synthase component I n=1 Tax=Gilvimarinus sp. DZF01 TaxID=3461371 RepID=UPI0040462D4C